MTDPKNLQEPLPQENTGGGKPPPVKPTPEPETE
jgi:hypothetical protein